MQGVLLLVSPHREEKKCRFCKESLPDWRQWLGTSSALQPQSRCRLPDTQDSSHSVLEGTARPSRPASLDTAAAAEPALSSATQGSVTESMTVSDSRSSEAAPLPVLPAPPPPPAFMRISYGGESYKIRVRSGAEGMAQFVLDCRKLLNIPPDQPFDVHFHCKVCALNDTCRKHPPLAETASTVLVYACANLELIAVKSHFQDAASFAGMSV